MGGSEETSACFEDGRSIKIGVTQMEILSTLGLGLLKLLSFGSVMSYRTSF